MDKTKLIKALTYLSIASVGLFITRVFIYGDLEFWYLNWNLILAAMPLLFSSLLAKRLKTTDWLELPNIGLGILWLGFLPNSFYIVTDFIHLSEMSSRTLVFDSVFLMVVTLTGVFFGIASVIEIHNQLRKRLTKRSSDWIIGLVFGLSSFAIYLGRYMRWNTWDILTNPAGLLFDVSDTFVNPRYGDTVWSTTVLFFCYMVILYIVALQFTPLDSGKKSQKKVK